jgi:hypothetical protein
MLFAAEHGFYEIAMVEIDRERRLREIGGREFQGRL